MKALAENVKAGKLYRVTKVPHWEYLTLGEVYECTNRHRSCVGLHRPNNGGGTFLGRMAQHAVEIEEAQS